MEEHKLIQVTFKMGNESVNLVASYRPPSTRSEWFIVSLNAYLQRMPYADIIYFLGDINIDINIQK